jgi:hypothetical protein
MKIIKQADSRGKEVEMNVYVGKQDSEGRRGPGKTLCLF